MSPIQGIDVSSWQRGAINWPAVRGAGYDFGIVKATQGVDYTSPTFAAQFAGLAEAGMVRGIYHYAEPDANEPEAELGWFLAQVAAQGGFLPGDFAMLDMERGLRAGLSLLPWTLRWLRGFAAAQSFQAMFYSRATFMAPAGLEDPAMADYGLVLAAYQAQEPVCPPPWDFIAIWQSGQGLVPGITSGPVDQDTFYGTVDQLRRYGKGAPPAAVWDDGARYQGVRFIVGGSGPRDLAAWLAGFPDG